MTLNSQKRILLCVSGSISAYKSADLTSLLKKRGYEVQCLLTAGAENFIPALVLETLSGRKIPRSLWDDSHLGTEHIRLARENDLIVFAPATAHLITRLALGLADDLVTTVALASRSPWMIAPAMNTVMWEAQTTQESVRKLEARGVELIQPAHGVLACGEEGAGKLAELDLIVSRIDEHFQAQARSQDLAGQNILITSGPTISRIDAVRYITNPSTGRMGAALAEEALARGASVCVVQGMDKGVVSPTDSRNTGRLTVVPVETAEEMRNEALKRLPGSTGVIATAAVLDYRVRETSKTKLKRGEESVSLGLEPSVDVLKSLRSSPTADHTWFMGFAAETDNLIENARLKLERKRLDWLFANWVAKAGDTSPTGFGSPRNAGVLLSSSGQAIEIPVLDKREVAARIVDQVAAYLKKS